MSRRYSILNNILTEEYLENLIKDRKYEEIFKFKYLSSEFIRENIDDFNFSKLVREQIFTSSLISELLIRFSKELETEKIYKNKVEENIKDICLFQQLDDGHYDEFASVLDWITISERQNLTLQQIQKYRGFIVIPALCRNPCLTIEIVDYIKHDSEVNFDHILHDKKFRTREFYDKFLFYIKSSQPFMAVIGLKELLTNAKAFGQSIYVGSGTTDYLWTKQITKDILIQFKDEFKKSDPVMWAIICSNQFLDDELFEIFEQNILKVKNWHPNFNIKDNFKNLSLDNLVKLYNIVSIDRFFEIKDKQECAGLLLSINEITEDVPIKIIKEMHNRKNSGTWLDVPIEVIKAFIHELSKNQNQIINSMPKLKREITKEIFDDYHQLG